MDSKGIFRSKMGGFNKKDVLQYIDEQAAQFQKELAEKDALVQSLQEQLTAAQTAADSAAHSHTQLVTDLASKAEQCDKLMAQAEEESAKRQEMQKKLDELQSFRKRNEDLTSRICGMETVVHEAKLSLQTLHDMQNRFNDLQSRFDQSTVQSDKMLKDRARLQEQIKDLTGQLGECHIRLNEAQQKLKASEAKNARYDDLIGNVGSFFVETRSLGQQMLEMSYKKSEGSVQLLLQAVENMANALSEQADQLKNVKKEIVSQKDASGKRLQGVLDAMQQSVRTVQQDSEDA